MTTPLEKIAEEKTGNYQSSLKGGGGGVPLIGKRPIYFRFFLLKASLSSKVIAKLSLILCFNPEKDSYILNFTLNCPLFVCLVYCDV